MEEVKSYILFYFLATNNFIISFQDAPPCLFVSGIPNRKTLIRDDICEWPDKKAEPIA